MDHCNGASAYVLRAVISAERQEIIVNVERFVKLMTGHFDNKEQFTEMKEEGKIFPYAQLDRNALTVRTAFRLMNGAPFLE